MSPIGKAPVVAASFKAAVIDIKTSKPALYMPPSNCGIEAGNAASSSPPETTWLPETTLPPQEPEQSEVAQAQTVHIPTGEDEFQQAHPVQEDSGTVECSPTVEQPAATGAQQDAHVDESLPERSSSPSTADKPPSSRGAMRGKITCFQDVNDPVQPCRVKMQEKADRDVLPFRQV